MHPRAYRPLYWWTERDPHGRQWCVYLTSDDLLPAMSGNMGLTVYTETAIYVWAGQSLDDMIDTVLHEIMHACLCKTELRDEETAISTITPRILPSLRRMGLRPPALPAGWRSLAAHARWIRFGSLQREVEAD